MSIQCYMNTIYYVTNSLISLRENKVKKLPNLRLEKSLIFCEGHRGLHKVQWLL